MGFGLRDYQMLLKVIGNLYAASTLAEVQEVTREGLAEALPGEVYDLVLFAGILPESDVFFSNPGTYTEEEMRYMLKNVTQHPLVPTFLKSDPGATSISQLVGSRQWWSSEFFRESGYQRLGLKHELAALLPGVSPTNSAAVSVLRTKKDFTERDREFLNRLRPHLGRVLKQTLLARPAPSPSLVQQIFPQLSEREAEVLYWITEGKQNREVADILERSLNTVQEHVENIIRKLKMENRHALAIFALRALLQG